MSYCTDDVNLHLSVSQSRQGEIWISRPKMSVKKLKTPVIHPKVNVGHFCFPGSIVTSACNKLWVMSGFVDVSSLLCGLYSQMTPVFMI